jgi:glutamate racemase
LTAETGAAAIPIGVFDSGVLAAALPRGVTIVGSAATAAATVLRQLHGAGGPLGAGTAGGTVKWLATDGAARFARVSANFLGEALSAEAIEIVDL